MNIKDFLHSKKSLDSVEIFCHNFSKLVLHLLFPRRTGMSQLQLCVDEVLSRSKLGVWVSLSGQFRGGAFLSDMKVLCLK